MTADEVVIIGEYVAPRTGKDARAPIAILLHMYNSTRSAFAPLIKPLHEAGFAVLAIDLRGHGESVAPSSMDLAGRMQRRDPDLFRKMFNDVTAAYLWLRDQPGVDPARFVLVGASVGCSVALDYAGRDRSVDGIVCMTPGTAYLGLDSQAHIEKCKDRPVLLMAAEEERSACDRLAKVVGESATVHTVPNQPALGEMGLHGTRMFGKVGGIEKTIVDFLVKVAGEPSSAPVVASLKGKSYYGPNAAEGRNLSRDNVRWFSSPSEAEARGFNASKAGSKSSSSRGGGRRRIATGERFPDGQ